MIGAEAAKTGSFLIRVGTEEETGEELSLANIEGRNVALRREDWEGEREVRHPPLMEAVDIAPRDTRVEWLYTIFNHHI